MQRYQHLFQCLDRQQQGAFVPFVTLGDPDYAQSLAIIETLVAAGADALELGMPFSDPLADGPTIQSANLRALNAGMTPDDCFTLLAEVRRRYPALPIGLLMYANLIFNQGIEQFYQRCAACGIDSVLIADVPLAAAKPFRSAALKQQIAPVFICPPNADDNLLRELASYGRGYTYLVSRSGVTGSENQSTAPLAQTLEGLHRYQAAPPLVGFGISTPEQVQAVISAGAAGAIAGSAIVKLIEHSLPDRAQMLQQIKSLVTALKLATMK